MILIFIENKINFLLLLLSLMLLLLLLLMLLLLLLLDDGGTPVNGTPRARSGLRVLSLRDALKSFFERIDEEARKRCFGRHVYKSILTSQI